MLTQEENDLLTQTGPGTPCGNLMRRYWQPAALSEELPAGGAPIPVRLFSEELVLFRDEQGHPGLLGLHCSHRGADLSYGRIEDGGLRCIYHGWLYDIQGNCLEQPGEPSWNAEFGVRSAESTSFHSPHSAFRIPHFAFTHTAYPCQEVGGVIYTYMGPGEPPLLPPYEFVRIPESHRHNSKALQDCNYLQGNEGNLDPVHLSFLHQMSTDNPESAQALNAQDRAPTLEVDVTGYGVRIYCVRRVRGERHYVRVTNYLLPNYSAVSGTADGYTVNWHVPIDDTHHWRYMIRFNRNAPMDRGARWFGRSEELTPDYRLVRNRANRYLQDREEMKSRTFLGLGSNFLAHDTCVTEGAGPIQDRTQEHPGYTDKGIFAARKLLMAAIRDVEAGRDPPGVVRDQASAEARGAQLVARSDVLLPASVDWRNYWEKQAEELQLTTLPV